MIKKNILISAYSFYPAVGGLEEQVLLLAKEWISLGHSVTVLTEKSYPHQPTSEIYHGIQIERIPFVKNRTKLDTLAIIVYLSLYIIRTRNTYDFCMLRAAITLYPLVFAFWKYLGVIQYFTYLSADTGGDHDEITLINQLSFRHLLYPIYSSHDVYNSICSDNTKHYRAIGIPAKKITTIPNGIPLPVQVLPPPVEIKTFLFLGRLYDYKGIHELLAAFKIHLDTHPQDKLIIGGVGPEAVYIQKFIQRYKLDASITAVGLVTPMQKEAFFLSGDCMVLPSYSEGFPVSVLEALSYSRAVICTAVSDLENIFGDQVFFCQRKSVQSLVQSLETVKKYYNPQLLRYTALLKRFDIRQIALKILEQENMLYKL